METRTSTLKRDDFSPSLSFGEWLNPANQLRWTGGLIHAWLISRNYNRLVLSIPFWLIIAGLLFFWWLQHTPDDSIVASYEAALTKAIAANDTAGQEVYLHALVELRPRDPMVRFRLARLLLESGSPEGLAYISELAPNDTEGFAPARMWLVEQAGHPNPIIPLTEGQIEGQLLKVLLQRPDDANAHRLLADIYIRKSEFKLAEEHLEQAARAFPALNTGLAKLKKKRERNPDSVRKHAQQADEYLSAQLAKHPADIETRIALADTKVLLDQYPEARELLASGLVQQDHPRLRRALSDLDLMAADQRLAESALNRDVCRALIENALKIDPSNVRAVQRLATVLLPGTIIDPETIQPTLDFWKEQCSQHPDGEESRLILSQLLMLTGQPKDAAEILHDLVETRPELRSALAEMLLAAQEHDEASVVLQSLIEEARNRLALNPGDVASAALKARCLLVGGQHDQAKMFLEAFAETNDGGRIPKDSSLLLLFGRACLSLYDATISADSSGPTDSPGSDSQTILQLLIDASSSPGLSGEVLNRLSQLAFSDHPAATQAEEMVRQLRLAGDPQGQILNLMGTQALIANEFEKARSYLEQANHLTRGKNPQTLNNLAIAFLRSEPKHLEKALELANQALTLLPDHPDVLSTRGELYLEMGAWQEALRDLQQALPLRRESKEIHQLLEKVYRALNDPDMAEAHRKVFDRLHALQGVPSTGGSR